jgi:hypothetical protein
LAQSVQNPHFPFIEKDVTGYLRNFAPKQGQQLDTPRQHNVQDYGPLEALSGLVLMLLHPAAGLQNPMPFLDAPPPAVIAHNLRRLLPRLDFLGRQQQPFNRLGLRGWLRFPYIDAPQRERPMGLQIAARRSHGDFLKAHTQVSRARR